MGDLATWLQSWWNSLSIGTHDNITAGLVVAFIIGVIAFLRNVLIAAGRRIFQKPVTQSSEQERRAAPASRDEQQQRRSLSEMRQRVRRFWIDGVLNKSLYKVVRIQLNIAERADAVDNQPWNLEMQQPDEASRMLPPNTRILDVFDQMGQRLLILGEPGSGKTTTLLELARDLLDRADRDPIQLTPIVFNLSSWAERRLPLAEWLIEEALTRYKVDKPVTRHWVTRDELILLLDGLDEVQEQHRAACVEAINTFQQQHIAVPLAICSRTTEYGRLTQQLNLSSAVVLQPLTANQIDDYFTQAGESLAALRAAVQQDKDLHDMAESPLLLSIMTLAYQGASMTEVSALDITQTRRQHLFDTYLARMFVRREVKHIYMPSKTLGWLRWLAQRMIQYGQTTFLIERIQPRWLQPTKKKHWLAYALMALWGPMYGLIFGLIGGLSVGLIVGLGYGLRHELSFGLGLGLRYMLVVGLISGLSFGLIGGLVDIFMGRLGTIPVQEQSQHYQIRMKSSFYSFALYGLVAMLCIGLMSRFEGMDSSDMMIFVPVYSLIMGLIGGLIGAYKPIRRVQKSNWSRRSFVVNLKYGLKSGLVIGLIAGLIAGLISVLNTGDLIRGLNYGLVIGLIGGLSSGLVFEPSPQGISSLNEITQLPNQAIRLATKYVLISSVVALLIFGSIGGLLLALIGAGVDGLRDGLSIGLLVGLIVGLIAGADIVIKHYFLRLALWLQGSTPRNYARFLDYAAALVFLRKVGGGYIFVHGLVMEHFAGLSDADIQRIVSAIPKQPMRKK